MRLLVKFSVIFLLVFGMGVAVAGWVCSSFLQRSARIQVLQQAKLMMAAAMSMRTYTTKQIRPLIDERSRKQTFFPQTVPAYAATESFNYLRITYPDYTYREATLNPTNLRDRAVDWETDVINVFRNDSKKTELHNTRDTPTGPALFLDRPLVPGPPCLECHDQPKGAPPAMIRAYGTANGFGWKNGETIGAQIVSVPMSVPIRMEIGRA